MIRADGRRGGTVLLDNEAVGALLSTSHAKHRRALALVEAVAYRNARRPATTVLSVPTAVRVEACWDRSDPSAAPINRLKVTDVELTSEVTNRAARLRAVLGLSVADAHLGAALETTGGPHTVITSDVEDVTRLCAHLEIAVTTIRL
ncbi:MAG: hypothetical protein ACT4PP_04825 [Sporichthyaceae bacterium]